jgi:N-methylhydantoinase B
VLHYGFLPDSGGPGKFRGGLAFYREWRLLADDATFTIRSDRRAHPPYGFAGGKPGQPSMNRFNSNGQTRVLPTMPMAAMVMRRGDSYYHNGAGGGGFGNPFERDPALVLEDVLDEKVSIEAAHRDYGVAIDPVALIVDVQATAKLRA